MFKRFKTWEDELKAEFKYEFRSLKDVDLKDALPVVVSRSEMKLLLYFYNGTGKKDIRNNLVIRVLYVTGLRISELAELKFCDINFKEGTFFIRSGKGDKDRYGCLEPETIKQLKKYQEDKPINSNIFPVTIRTLQRIVKKAGDETGISEKYEAMGRVFSAHSLRHTYASHCYENGMRLFSLRKLLGHEYLGTTQIYVDTAIKYDYDEYIKTHPLKIILRK